MPDKTTLCPADAGHPFITNAEKSILDTKQEITELTTSSSSRKDDPNDIFPNAKVSSSANDPELIPGIEDIDPDLHSDAVEALKEALANRKATSRENGSQGGRPPINLVNLAMLCIGIRFIDSETELPTLHHYKGSWYLYDDGCYRSVSDGDMEKIATGFLTQVKDLKGAVSTSLVNNVLNIMKSDEFCGLTEKEYQMPCFISNKADASRFLPMRNGLLDIEATLDAMSQGAPLPALLPKTPDLFCVHSLRYDYDPTAECPHFLQYLAGVQPNPENRENLQMLAGYLLVQDCSYNVAFFLYGEGGTGKSVFMNVLEGLLGAENCCSVPLANLGDRFTKVGLTENMANLVGDMPVIPDSGRLAEMEGILKTVTSGETLFVERKNKDGWEAKATARCVFATNELPPFSDRSNGVWDRLRLTPFNVVFRNTDQQNPHLSEELLEERPGIFNWALRGLLKLRGLRTFPHCSEGLVCLEEHRTACDHEKAFLLEKTVAAPDACISSSLLYDEYKRWMRESNYRPVGLQKFKLAVLKAYPTARHVEREYTVQGRMAVFHGISWSN